METGTPSRPSKLRHPFSVIMHLVLIGTFLLIPGDVPGSEVRGTDQFEYGIPIDASRVTRDVVKRNQNLAKILLAHNVPHAVIDTVAKKSKTVFDVRKMRAGNPYCLISKPGANDIIQYFVYEQDPINYVVYNLVEPEVYVGNKSIETKVLEVSAVIDTSLSYTFDSLGLDFFMAEKLSDIYSWTIDFHHLQKGDHFKILYEENFVDGKPIGYGNILAARFNHIGRDFYGFYFEKSGIGNYYNEKGSSMQQAFLKAPLKYSRITSKPSKRRLHPIHKVYKPHFGTDYAAPMGTPIHSVGEGIIQEAGYHPEFGKYVAIKHNGTYKTEYLHMSRIAPGIKAGVRVGRGDVIGYVGKTGLATGPHLCFRFWKNGKTFDPGKESLPVGDTLQIKDLQLFRSRIKAIKPILDTPPQPQPLQMVGG